MPTPDHAPLLELEAPPQHLMIEAPAVSSDVVPMSTVRAAWNIVQRGNPDHVELPHHDSLLTAEQARRINQHYEIVVAVGRHGFGILNKPPGLSHVKSLPTQREFDSAGNLVEGLDEGDTLFVEERGFSHQPAEMPTWEELMEYAATFDAVANGPELPMGAKEAAGALMTLGRVIVAASSVFKLRKTVHDSQQAQAVRQEYLASAWTYASLLAGARGVRVRHADYDLFNDIAASRQLGKDRMQQMMSDDMEGYLQFLRICRQRELVARNAIKDWALENLPPEGAPPPQGRKPKLVLLFGAAHKDSLIQAFKDMGLEVTVNDLEQSSEEERLAEHGARDMADIFRAIMLIAQNVGEAPLDLSSVEPLRHQPKNAQQHAAANK